LVKVTLTNEKPTFSLPEQVAFILINLTHQGRSTSTSGKVNVNIREGQRQRQHQGRSTSTSTSGKVKVNVNIREGQHQQCFEPCFGQPNANYQQLTFTSFSMENQFLLLYTNDQ